MTFVEATPPIGHRDRKQFEAAYQEGNTLHLAALSLDYKVGQLQGYANAQAELPDFSDEIAGIKHIARTALDTISADSQKSWQDYYHLLSRYAFVEEMIYTPAAFSEQRHYRRRHELTNGVYGVNAYLLEGMLLHYDRAGDDDERGALRGVINEQTAIALLNRDQSPSRLALPAASYQDAHLKTDATYHLIVAKQPYVANIQVKSSEPPRYKRLRVTPRKGLLVTAHDMDNAQNNFRTSRAIVSEIYNTATDEQLERLELTHRRFADRVDRRAARAVIPPQQILDMIPNE